MGSLWMERLLIRSLLPKRLEVTWTIFVCCSHHVVVFFTCPSRIPAALVPELKLGLVKPTEPGPKLKLGLLEAHRALARALRDVQTDGVGNGLIV